MAGAQRIYRLLAEVLAQHLLATSEHPCDAPPSAGRRWAGLAQHQIRSDDLPGPGAAAPISAEAATATVVRTLGNIGFPPELSADTRPSACTGALFAS
jgi:hypothetical protein